MGTFTDELQMVWPFRVSSVRSNSKRLFKNQTCAIARDLDIQFRVQSNSIESSRLLVRRTKGKYPEPDCVREYSKGNHTVARPSRIFEIRIVRRRLDLKK